MQYHDALYRGPPTQNKTQYFRITPSPGEPMSRSLVFSLLAVAAMASSGRAATYAPQLGRRHADFTLPAIDDGRPVALSQFRGKKVLLIHFASW
jgi:hypothetical protein